MDEIGFILDPENVSVSGVQIWRDGGTVSVIFSDGLGHQYPCCFEGSFGKNAGRLYVGAMFAGEPQAQLVPLGNPIEQIILSILRRHLDRQFTRAKQESLAKRDGSRGFIDDSITEQEYNGWLLLDRINRLEILTEEAQQT